MCQCVYACNIDVNFPYTDKATQAAESLTVQAYKSLQLCTVKTVDRYKMRSGLKLSDRTSVNPTEDILFSILFYTYSDKFVDDEDIFSNVH